MAVEPEFEELLRELFEPLGAVTLRRMFGGLGIFRHGLMFAVCSSDCIVALKADQETIPAFENEGCVEWMPHISGRKPISMGYWQVPERLLEEPDAMRDWAVRAFDAAVRIDQAKPKSKRKLQIC